jgi:hypothetical protein
MQTLGNASNRFLMNDSLHLTSTITSRSTVSSIDSTKSNEFSILWAFADSYRPIHGWMATFVCLFGIPANMLNIIVLTRPNMISSPTNLILTGLALSDLLTMLSSLPYTVYYSLLYANQPGNEKFPERDTKLWTHFAQIHVMASVTFHSISIWFTVYLACFRYIYLASSTPAFYSLVSNSRQSQNPLDNKRLTANNNFSNNQRSSNKKRSCLPTEFVHRCLLFSKTYKSTIISMLFICIFCVLFCFPAYIYPTVRKTAINVTITNSASQNVTTKTEYAYYIDPSDLDNDTNGLIFKIMFYSQAIFAKIVPCILLVTFSSLLIRSLVIINRNKRRLNQTNIKFEKSLRKNSKMRKTADINLKKISFMTKFFRYVVNRNKKANEKDFEKMSEQQKMQIDNLINKEEKDASLAYLMRKRNSASVVELESSNQRRSLVMLSRRLSDIRNVSSFNHNRNLSQRDNQCRKDQQSDCKRVHFKNIIDPIGSKKKPWKSNNKQSSKTKNTKEKKPKRNRAKENLRTTLMLTIVCVLFLITEAPQSVLILFSILMDNQFYSNVYLPMGDVLDMLALINNSINFLLYCSMSRAFRNTFYNLIMNSWCSKKFNQVCVPKLRKKQLVNSNNFSYFTADSAFNLTTLNKNNEFDVKIFDEREDVIIPNKKHEQA